MIGKSNAGSSGVSAPDAVLRVTAPANSTVTITKGSVTLSPSFIVVSGSSYVHYFYIPQSKFDSTAWVIHGTRNPGDANEEAVDSTSQTPSGLSVVIDAAKEYNVTLIYRLVLYDYGTRPFNWSSARTSSSYGSGGVSYGSNYVQTYAQWANVAASTGTWGWPVKVVNFSLYSTGRVVAGANDTGGRIGFTNTSRTWLSSQTMSTKTTTTYNFNLASVTGTGYYNSYITSGSTNTWYIRTYQVILFS